MQRLVEDVRNHLTDAEVTAILQAPALEVAAGLELLDGTGALVDDISDDLEGGEIRYSGIDAKIHRTARLRITRQLQWGTARLRPYMTLSDGTNTARFDLGVFIPSTPDTVIGEEPATYDVEAYDKLVLLDNAIGESYHVAAGTGVLTAAEAVINLAGETAVTFADAGDEPPLQTDRVWSISEDATYLTVVNDLLKAGGYRQVWCDQLGRYRSAPYMPPGDRGTEYTYDADDAAVTIVGEDRTETTDLHEVPNVWVFTVDDPALLTPVEGNGIYTVTNQSTGPASIDARGGREVRKVIYLDAVNQASLEQLGDERVDTDLRSAVGLRLTTGPNPLHGHDDLVALVYGSTKRYLVAGWSLPLDGTDMTHDWSEI